MQTLRLGCVGCPATTSSWVGGWELKKASILLGDLQKSEPLFGGSCFWSLRWLTTPLSVKWIAERNHPRVVQEPAAVLHHVSIADIQWFLTESNLQQAVEKAGFDYDDVSDSLDVLGMSGLEQFSGIGCSQLCLWLCCQRRQSLHCLEPNSESNGEGSPA